MRIALDQLKARGVTPDLVVSDHGMAGYASSTCKLLTIGIADCNDPGSVLWRLSRGDLARCALPMDDKRSAASL